MENNRKVVLIVAIAENLAIGMNNKLLCNIPKDLQRFKNLTTNNSVIMGRKTWESLPPKFRPLPNRKNIILTKCKHNANFANLISQNNPNIAIYNNLEMAIQSEKALLTQQQKIFIIGGANVYQQALQANLIDCLEITHIKKSFDNADAFLELSKNELQKTWKKINSEQFFCDEISAEIEFATYIKK